MEWVVSLFGPFQEMEELLAAEKARVEAEQARLAEEARLAAEAEAARQKAAEEARPRGQTTRGASGGLRKPLPVPTLGIAAAGLPQLWG